MAKGRVLVIDDEKLVRWSLQQKLIHEGYDVETAPSGEEGLNLIKEDVFDLVLLDIRLPGMDGVQTLGEIMQLGRDVGVIMLTAETAISRAVECVRLGAFNYLCKPFDFEEVRVAIEKAREELKLRREVTRMRSQQRRRFGFQNLVGESAPMKAVRDLIFKIAASGAGNVLVEGENGTGKELAARAIHFGSPRADQPFLDINCSAVPENLFESELFGHERGAFTDAKMTKKGLFEMADGGTLLLDEIADMKPPTQAKLLRVLENHQFRRVGGTRDITVDVRIIASTNRNLPEMVASGEFRQDLFYRLKVISVTMPPLRDRASDIPVLAEHFLAGYTGELKKPVKKLAPQTMEALQKYAWPGNVRELRNVIERIVLLEADAEILPRHLPVEISLGVKTAGKYAVELPAGGVELSHVERELVWQAMERVGGNQTKAAELLGIERDALRRRLTKYGIAETGSPSGTKA